MGNVDNEVIRRSALAGFLPAITAAFVVQLVDLTAQVPPSSQPHAVLAEVEHDFGTVSQGVVVRHTFTIRNDGAVPLEIRRIDMLQPSMKSRFPSVVAPGAEGRITIEWDTTRISGELSAEAVVTTNDPTRPDIRLSLRGAAIAPLAIEPAPILFFSVYRDETASQRVSLVNNQSHAVAVNGLRPEGEHFQAAVETVEAGKRHDIVVTIPPGLPAGRYRESLVVITDDPERRQIAIGVNVFVKNDVYASPELIEFDDVSGAQLRSQSRAALLTQTITLLKRTGRFSVTGMVTDVPGVTLELEPALSTPSESFRLSVGLAPPASGSLEGSVRITTDDDRFPDIVIPIRGAVR